MITRPTRAADRLILAIDTPDPAAALALAARVGPHVGLVKAGLELFCAAGPDGVAPLIAAGPVFLDLKLHDIPNTVAGAVRSACALGPSMLTIHAGGGAPMIAAARRAADAFGPSRPIILAVTVLTSIDAATLAETGVAGGPVQQVLRLARLAMESGADGLVCSPHEVAAIRATLGDAPLLVVPGVRPTGSAIGDQARVATPAETVAAGADWLVIGRPITQADDPVTAAQDIAKNL
ncbi:orotidine-5'-phosphate decarboxylase [Humitalea sp. 24SJ18S-53]|uniref:orotidine-5'-phosphate decarboxylase n=1 Tax=Humitalea sp. 24SJ18S-53 TaxID=3422307 RepID=UPI003D666ABF